MSVLIWMGQTVGMNGSQHNFCVNKALTPSRHGADKWG